MEGALTENNCAEDTAKSKLSAQREEIPTESPQLMQEKPVSAMENGIDEEEECAGQEEQEEDQVREDGQESCLNSVISAGRSAGKMNGGTELATTNTSPKTQSKSPSVNRTGRRNQEMKDRSTFLCPLCDKNCLTQHQLTMHIRQHNTESGGTDHSCSICGKALSSASSLDRHMLVHSGERPYKCSVCGQTFTTNGNMHRHMKIHDKDPSSVPASSPASPNKRRRSVVKRKLSIEEDKEKITEPPSKKVSMMQQSGERGPAKQDEEILHCPICFKTFICTYGLESHMETHPDTALRCNLCCITFRTHRGLLRHNAIIHKQLPTDPSGKPFIQSNPSIPTGFSDLSFIDFSCHKFPKIAQVWCETNLRRCSSKFHRFVCEVCDKAFPLQESVHLHSASHKDDTSAKPSKHDTETIMDGSKNICDSVISKEVNEPTPDDINAVTEKKAFIECLGLQPSSIVKSERSEEEIQQELLDSIRFIRVESPATNLPQETNGSLGFCLLDPVAVQGLSKSTGLGIVSLQPLQGGLASGSLVVRPVGSQTGVELADIQQILKMAACMPSQVTLFPKTPESPLQAEPKQIKANPSVTPRTSMETSTPPPLVMNAQQASSGCISPGLPPPTGQLLLTSKQSVNSSSSSLSSSPTNWENGTVATIPTYNTSTSNIKQEVVEGREKDVRTSVSKKPLKTEYPCRFCKQVFSFPGGLQAHMRDHLGASPYQCSICTYSAPDNATLIRHLRTHSGERPYVCRLCHYPFTVKANCERHLRKKHMKTTRKEIEKNIEYVTTSSSVPGIITSTTLDVMDSTGTGNTLCRYCGEDLKSYRALQIHLRTHNGCQKKPYECRQCGAAFLAKRNCIHHLLKQHPDVPEREIEEHINTLIPVTVASSALNNSPALASNGLSHAVQQFSSESSDQEQPLDFSSKSSKNMSSDVKPEAVLPSSDSSLEPIDLSIPKGSERKKLKREVNDTTSVLCQQIKKELTSTNTDKSSGRISGVHAPPPLSISSLASTLMSDLPKPLTRLKPLLPKPVSASNTSEMPPLASIAQIISSVSAAPVLLKTGMNAANSGGVTLNDTVGSTGSPESSFSGSSHDASKRRGKKRTFKEEMCDITVTPLSKIDLESSGEFPSVEKMLATTDANKFSPYLQPRQLESENEKPSTSDEERERKKDKAQIRPQSKGKKNAYSNSVQKMKCPYCPRVFPWTSSLQRHMLTHTGQKPFPCPQCDAFFSTKSNCERHLLRKHGVSNRNTLQNTGSRLKHKTDEGSQGSTEGTSDAEPAMADDTVNPKKEEKGTAADKPLTEELENKDTEEPECKKDPESSESVELSQVNMNIDENDDDSQSNKSLDVNFGSKIIEFKLSGPEQKPSEATEPTLGTGEFPHTCGVCRKTFRHAATLIRHQKIHLQQNVLEDRGRKGKNQSSESNQAISTSLPPKNEVEQEARAEKEESGSVMESGAEEEDKDSQKEERSDEEDEGGSSELRSLEEESESRGGKSDKRKKICDVCSKRFWSLQDLTRHMRSHTGERPYKCQTCERTFTLKHSLVRHQRIHQKAPDSKGTDETDDLDEADGAKDASSADGEELRSPSGSESETTAPAENETERLGSVTSQTEDNEQTEKSVENQEAPDMGQHITEEDSVAEPLQNHKTNELEEGDCEAEKGSMSASANSDPAGDPEPEEEGDTSLKRDEEAPDASVL